MSMLEESAEIFPPLYTAQLEDEGEFVSVAGDTPDLNYAIDTANSYAHKGRTRVLKIERGVAAEFPHIPD